MGEVYGLTAEQYQAIVAIVDDRLEAVRVTREGFERLETVMARLAEAQARTEERIGQVEVRVGRLEEALARLAEAQARTEARVGQLEEVLARLAEAQARTETRLDQLATAQARTEMALQQLARQVGGLSDTVGGIEDIAYIVLHDVLQRDFGWQVGVLERTWQQWNGESEEINVFGQATDPTYPERTIWIVGEAKHNLTLREVERFAQQIERARRHLAGEVYVVCFCYRARPEVRARLRALGIPLLFSYGRFA
jgi:hypothetical protein